MYMIKTFKNRKAMETFIKKHLIIWQEIFIDNVPYAIEYKKIDKIIY